MERQALGMSLRRGAARKTARGGPPSILCISSHVARGTVGNRAAAFACEVLGHPVWSVPTILLPWHPGQGKGTRMVWPAEQFAALLDDLASSPRLGEVGAVLTGYLGSAEQAAPIAALVDAVKRRNPGAAFCCDPVIGNASGLYVPQATAHAIERHLIPRADIITPNRHELAWLADRDGADADAQGNAGLVALARKLARPLTLVTSAYPATGGSPGRSDEGSRTANLLVSQADDEALLASHEVVDAPNSGTGDLTAGLLLARIVDGHSLGDALRLATAGVLEAMRAEAAAGEDELPLERVRPMLEAPRAPVDLERFAAIGPRIGA